MDEKKNLSLSQYFEDDTKSGNAANFFDNLSEPTVTSAMMTSVVQSGSSQSLFELSKRSDSISSRLDALQLNANETEPVICKIFSENAPEQKTIFDMISPSEIDSSLNQSWDLNEGPYPSPLQGFEDVSDPINCTESDRTREAWIPSETTRRALIMAATSQPGKYYPDKNLLTMPGVLLDRQLVDEVTELIRRIFGEEEALNRKVLTVNDVAQDEKGLRELIQAECYRAAVNLTGKLLAMRNQGVKRQNHPSRHSVQSIQIWFTRLCLLVKLQAFEIANEESKVWWNLDRPDLYYQFYPEVYGGKLGTMVPFQMRLLIATIPAYVKDYSQALQRLYSILAIVQQILNNLESGKSEDGSTIEINPIERELAQQVWKSREARVQHSIVNVALMSKNYLLAIEIMLNLIKNNKSPNQKRALQSALGRIFLELGDISNASKCFAIAKELKRNQKGTLSESTSDLRELVDKGLCFIADDNYKGAYETFQKASMIEPSNIMVLNNLAICKFYMGDLKSALKIYESTVKMNPSLALHESILINMCSLYELEGSNTQRQELLLKEIAKYKGDSINISCLKLQKKR